MAEKSVMKGFERRFYFADKATLSEHQLLQLEIAQLIYTSIEDARATIRKTSERALVEALKLMGSTVLKKAIEIELRKREKGMARNG